MDKAAAMQLVEKIMMAMQQDPDAPKLSLEDHVTGIARAVLDQYVQSDTRLAEAIENTLVFLLNSSELKELGFIERQMVVNGINSIRKTRQSMIESLTPKETSDAPARIAESA